VTAVASRPLRDRWRSIEAQRRAGRLMVGVGFTGALLAVVGSITAWLFVGELHDATDESLAVTVETLDSIDDTIDLADDVLGSTTDVVAAVAGTLESLSGSFDTATTAIDDVAGLAESLGPSLDEATSTTRTLEEIGAEIDRALVAVSSLPIGPDYDPESGLGETFGRLTAALEPIGENLSTTATSLTEFTDSAGELSERLATLTDSVQGVSADLADSDLLVDQYRARVAEARALAVDTRADLGDDVRLMRLLIAIGGLTLLIGQIVPLWVGRSVLDEVNALAADVTDVTDATSTSTG